jgi:hypothetical protein
VVALLGPGLGRLERVGDVHLHLVYALAQGVLKGFHH